MTDSSQQTTSKEDDVSNVRGRARGVNDFTQSTVNNLQNSSVYEELVEEMLRDAFADEDLSIKRKKARS